MIEVSLIIKASYVDSQLALISGGAGNRTPVPWHFSVGFYVCILPLVFRPRATRQAGFPEG